MGEVQKPGGSPAGLFYPRNFERETRIELATSTLGRLRSAKVSYSRADGSQILRFDDRLDLRGHLLDDRPHQPRVLLDQRARPHRVARRRDDVVLGTVRVR